MARLGVVVASSVVVGALLASVGCGSDGESTFGASGGTSGSSGNASSGSLGSSSGGASSGASGGTSGTSGGVGTVVDPAAACATSNAGVDSLPIYLVFMIDHSGSMGGNAASLRWNPLQSGLNSFFADPANANVHAAMAFFSQGADKNPGDPGCQAATYQAEYTGTGVPMTALPNGAPFSTAFTTIGAPAAETPTLPAEQGAIAYATTIKAGLKPGEQVAIVLATDGQPNNCSSTVTAVATAAAAGAAAGIKTYVVGVGPSTGNLDQIAVGGGTGPTAIMINTASTAQVSADLRAAIGKIKASQLSCNYSLPAPPAGQTLDVNAVNVNFTPGGGVAATLPYSANCTDPNGWHYDNTTAPTQIIMCADRCTALQGDTTGGKLDIIFGCAITAPPGTQLPGGGVK
jgi:hypothetical protein